MGLVNFDKGFWGPLKLYLGFIAMALGWLRIIFFSREWEFLVKKKKSEEGKVADGFEKGKNGIKSWET